VLFLPKKPEPRINGAFDTVGAAHAVARLTGGPTRLLLGPIAVGRDNRCAGRRIYDRLARPARGGPMLFQRNAAKDRRQRIDSAMTPMIDVVFQLLAFFILTFQLVVPEGDFDIEMPPLAGAEAPRTLVEPLRVRLIADSAGALADVRVGERSLGRQIAALGRHVKRLAGDPSGPDGMKLALEVELDCDAGLRYEHAMAALASVTRGVDAGGNSYRLVDRVRFDRQWQNSPR
jgi:biopolymer transport protein ExbD